jgi:hypothetical protein
MFRTPHDTALEALGALPGGRTWGAFDVSKAEAEKGRATRYVMTLWNSPRIADGRPDASSKALVRDADGTWWYHVRRPGPRDISQWKALWGSLQLCQRTALPIVGVLKDRSSKLCALEVTFDCGPFLGSFEDDEVWMQARPRDPQAVEVMASHDSSIPNPLMGAKLECQSAALETTKYFDAADLVDARARLLREVVQRRGQAAFRRSLLAAYGGRCAVTGCDAVDALEAAHIVGYLGPATQHVGNGLLLRADIHSLFDLGLLSVCPETLTVHLAQALRNSSYGGLQGQKLKLPEKTDEHPDCSALRQRWRKQD